MANDATPPPVFHRPMNYLCPHAASAAARVFRATCAAVHFVFSAKIYTAQYMFVVFVVACACELHNKIILACTPWFIDLYCCGAFNVGGLWHALHATDKMPGTRACSTCGQCVCLCQRISPITGNHANVHKKRQSLEQYSQFATSTLWIYLWIWICRYIISVNMDMQVLFFLLNYTFWIMFYNLEPIQSNSVELQNKHNKSVNSCHSKMHNYHQNAAGRTPEIREPVASAINICN